jgi:hypothetical protein
VTDKAAFHYDVFVSYATADKTWVNKSFVPALEAAGLKVCIFPRDQHVGRPKIDDLEQSVITSRHTVLILTPEFLASEWTEFTGSLVQTLDVAARHERVIPLIRKACDLPRRIAYLTPADFTATDEVESTWRKLLEAFDAPIIDQPAPRIASPYDDKPAPKPPASDRAGRATRLDRPKRSIGTSFRATLASPLWQGIAGIAAIAALIVTIALATNPASSPAPSVTATIGVSPTIHPIESPTVALTQPPAAQPTDTPTATDQPTDVPIDTPAPTAIDLSRATANTSASIFTAPNVDPVDFVSAGQTVIVLGRAYSGNWLYVQTTAGKKGFAYRPLFDWSGDLQSLTPIPVPVTAMPTRTTTPSATLSSDYIGVDFFIIGNGFCSPKPGYHLYLRGLGELFPFKYYVDGALVYTGSDQYTFDYNYPAGTSLVKVTARVEARDGRRVEQSLALRKPNCPG